MCPTFADVQLDEEAMVRDLPEDAVPRAFVDHATSMPETASMRTTMDGPASRHSQFAPNPEEESDSSCSDHEAAAGSSAVPTSAHSGVPPPASAHDERAENDEEPSNELSASICFLLADQE